MDAYGVEQSAVTLGILVKAYGRVQVGLDVELFYWLVWGDE